MDPSLSQSMDVAGKAGFGWCGEGDTRYKSVTEMEILEV